MKKLVVAIVMLAAFGLAAPSAQASTLTWVELGFTSSANPGTVYDNPYFSWPPPTADLSGFNMTTGLGSISFTFSGAGTHYVAGFFDYQFLDVANNNGFFDETAAYFGSLAAGWSAQADDSFGSSIFADFQAFNATTPLSGSVVGAPPYDVAVALGYAFTLTASDPARQVIFTVGLTAPTSGWYIQHNDPLSGQSVYFSGSTQDLGQPVVPEPGTLVLLGIGLVVAGRKLYRRP
jgi:hypothetical protein